jgi:hypothetical protein
MSCFIAVHERTLFTVSGMMMLLAKFSLTRVTHVVRLVTVALVTSIHVLAWFNAL